MPALPPARMVIYALLALLLAGCAPATPRITPVDEEFNQSMLTGKGLDHRLYDMRERLQYFEAANMEALPPAEAAPALDRFIHARYGRTDMARLDALAVLVYRKRALGGYDDLLHESARDNEAGLLRGQTGQAVAQVRLKKFGEGARWTRRMVLYRNGAITLQDATTRDAAVLFHE